MLSRETRSSNGLPPLVPWEEFLRSFRWRQGEHVVALAPTGKGKTTIALSLLPKRKYVCVIATKPKDPLLSKLRRQGFYITRTWPISPTVHPRVVFWPASGKLRDSGSDAYKIADCLEQIYEAGGWTVYCDEIRDLSEMGLKGHLTMLYRNGRSLKISMVGGSQRPFWIPKESYDQATHLFIGRTADDAGRMGELSGNLDKKAIANIVQRLPLVPGTTASQFLYLNTATGEMVRTQARRR